MTPQWRELIRCDSLAEANVIATSIEAMEFEIGLRSSYSDEPLDAAAIEDLQARGDADVGGPFVIEARAEDYDDLAGVVEEIRAEQGEFDERLEHRDRAVGVARRGMFLVLLAGAMALAAYLFLRGA